MTETAAPVSTSMVTGTLFKLRVRVKGSLDCDPIVNNPYERSSLPSVR